MKEQIPGERGLIGLTVATIGVCAVMSVFGDWSQWLPCAAGLYMGWRYVIDIGRK